MMEIIGNMMDVIIIAMFRLTSTVLWVVRLLYASLLDRLSYLSTLS